MRSIQLGGKFGDIEFTHRYMTEKYDGIRAYWDGCKLKSRSNVDLVAPQIFLQGLPSKLPLDGELWYGSTSKRN